VLTHTEIHHRDGTLRSDSSLAARFAAKEAVAKALAGKSLSRTDLLQAVMKLGYTFTAKKPLNSLSTLLYSDRSIKNNGGKFSIAK